MDALLKSPSLQSINPKIVNSYASAAVPDLESGVISGLQLPSQDETDSVDNRPTRGKPTQLKNQFQQQVRIAIANPTRSRGESFVSNSDAEMGGRSSPSREGGRRSSSGQSVYNDFEETKEIPPQSEEEKVETFSHGFYKYPKIYEPGKPKTKPKKYVFIPAKAMQHNDFSFETAFEVLGLDTPSIIFRLNSANDTQKWNMRLPHARMELAAFQFELDHPDDEIIKNVKGLADLVHAAADAADEKDSECSDEYGDNPEAAGGGGNDSLRKGPSRIRRGSAMGKTGDLALLAAKIDAESPEAKEKEFKDTKTAAPEKDGKHNANHIHSDMLWHKILDLREKAAKAQIKHHLRDSYRSALTHYQGVLREKCKRLLKGTYAACEQAGAMFRIDEMWSEDYRNDAVTSWLTNHYRDEHVNLLGVGDINYLHASVRDGLMKNHKPYNAKTDESIRPMSASALLQANEEKAFELPREVVYGFELAESIRETLRQIKKDRGITQLRSTPPDQAGGEDETIDDAEVMWKPVSEGSSGLDDLDKEENARRRAIIEELRADITNYLLYIVSSHDKEGEGYDLQKPEPAWGSGTHILDWTDQQKMQRFLQIYGFFYDPLDREELSTIGSDRNEFFQSFYNVYNGEPPHYIPLRTKMGPITYQPGKKKGSFPHRGVTHLILTDDIDLLEQKLVEVVPWGAILINGQTASADMAVDCIQNGRPLISVKYTGGSADLVVGMLERRKFFLQARKLDPNHAMEDVAYNIKIPKKGWVEKDWLREFDVVESSTAVKMNVLLENWPDRFSEASVFIVDTFQTTEDDVQDRITQTMGVVFESAHELGGSVSEQKRLTYAWRLRHKFLFNANLFKLISDILMLAITLLTLSSTMSAVLYSFFTINPDVLVPHEFQITQAWLNYANLILPLAATIFRGIYASVSPMLKYVALKNACVQVESEIYMYRTKVGKYGVMFRKRPDADKDKDKDKKSGDKKNSDGDDKKSSSSSKRMGGNNPRKAFSNALDSIWAELGTSGESKTFCSATPTTIKLTAPPSHTLAIRCPKWFSSHAHPARRLGPARGH